MPEAITTQGLANLNCEGGTEMFGIGDKVVHPTHGAGQVTGIKEQDLLEQYHRYYVIDLAVDDRTLMIPVSNAKEIGLRSISREAALSKVWRTLSGAGESLSDDYKKRQKRVQKKLKTGDVIKVAEVIRDLSTRKREDHLTSFDTKLFERAQQFLASEVALAEGVQVSEAEQMIYETLNNGVGSPEAHEEEATEKTKTTEIHQPILTNREIWELAKQAMRRLHPG
jgi:CarD family transcriptional regulator